MTDSATDASLDEATRVRIRRAVEAEEVVEK